MTFRFRTALAIVSLSISPILILAFFFLGNRKAFAQENKNSFITIVNPVRIAPYTINSAESIEAQYSEVKKRSLPATWLFSYDVIENKDSVRSIKNFDEKQELGILMEVSSTSAKTAGVAYNLTDSWHRSNSIFLSGYSQEDRIKLIDSAFESFKKKFGYYPLSVGAWWIDSFSLDYMSEKYKVIANLNVSDQAGTDGYHVWGTYWSSPYYPNKYNTAFPAPDLGNKIDIVTLRWASRDPLNGYKSPDGRESTRFSTQDYFTIGLGHEYFEQLLRLYTKDDFSQVTIGLEGDFPAETYSGNFATHLSIAERLSLEQRIKFTTMKEFARGYQKKFPDLSPAVFIETDDLLGSSKKIFWFQNPRYRIGIVYDRISQETQIIDFRSYFRDFTEPFYYSSNKQYDLFAIVPHILDSSSNLQKPINLEAGALLETKKENGEYLIEFEKGKVSFGNERIDIESVPFVFNSKRIRVDGSSITAVDKFEVPPEGMVFVELKPKIPFALKLRIPPAVLYLAILFSLASIVIVLIVTKNKNKRFFKLVAAILVFMLLGYMFSRVARPLYVSQSEIDALFFLAGLNDGKVLLYDKDCLRCKWMSKNKPAAMEGRKEYVKKFSDKEIKYSLDFVLAKNPEEAKEILKKSGARYIYLTKYEDYIEAIAFNPVDVGIKKVYENANAAIYEVN